MREKPRTSALFSEPLPCDAQQRIHMHITGVLTTPLGAPHPPPSSLALTVTVTVTITAPPPPRRQVGGLRGQSGQAHLAVHRGARDPADGRGMPVLPGAQPRRKEAGLHPEEALRIPLQGTTRYWTGMAQNRGSCGLFSCAGEAGLGRTGGRGGGRLVLSAEIVGAVCERFVQLCGTKILVCFICWWAWFLRLISLTPAAGCPLRIWLSPHGGCKSWFVFSFGVLCRVVRPRARSSCLTAVRGRSPGPLLPAPQARRRVRVHQEPSEDHRQQQGQRRRQR